MMDIREFKDIKTLVDAFYSLAQHDPQIGPAFEGVDWAHHLPIMYGFWAFLLLGEANPHASNPLEKHRAVHERFPLLPEHFDRWVALFQSAVDAHFSGPKADDAKQRAWLIAETWKSKFRFEQGL
jgi:hemoglobin